MKVLIAAKDAVFARMLSLEFREKGIPVLQAQTYAEIEEALSHVHLAIIEDIFLPEKPLPPFPYDIILFGFLETLAKIPTQELTKYYTLTRPFDIEEFFLSLFAPEEEMPRSIRVPKRKSPSESLALDITARAAYYKGEKISLTQKEFALLAVLFENRGHPVSREQAHEAVFADTESKTNVVDVYVNYLRTKIDHRFGIRMISTVRGLGYMIQK